MQDLQRIQQLAEHLSSLQSDITTHHLYGQIRTVAGLRVFMEHHVFAVWDFMSLLKGLQAVLTGHDLPWRPVGDAATRRFVNEIVLEEESDLIDGEAIGHFELYLRAMRQAGAETGAIEAVMARAADGMPVEQALSWPGVPPASAAFSRATFRSLEGARPHVIASAFTFGREMAVPSMFRGIVERLGDRAAELTTLMTYLERHCQLDEEEHGPKAVAMLAQLCGDDDLRWHEARVAATAALRARMLFWDGISGAIARLDTAAA